jgi:hypothetical protein
MVVLLMFSCVNNSIYVVLGFPVKGNHIYKLRNEWMCDL